MRSLKPYEEMNSLEIVSHWARLDIKAPGGHSVFRSPNKAIWAIVDERMGATVVMWDCHTGYIYNEKPEQPRPGDLTRVNFCVNCGHEIRWSRVGVPPRWQHVRRQSGDDHSRLSWICECGCMDAKPREAQP